MSDSRNLLSFWSEALIASKWVRGAESSALTVIEGSWHDSDRVQSLGVPLPAVLDIARQTKNQWIETAKLSRWANEWIRETMPLRPTTEEKSAAEAQLHSMLSEFHEHVRTMSPWLNVLRELPEASDIRVVIGFQGPSFRLALSWSPDQSLLEWANFLDLSMLGRAALAYHVNSDIRRSIEHGGPSVAERIAYVDAGVLNHIITQTSQLSGPEAWEDRRAQVAQLIRLNDWADPFERSAGSLARRDAQRSSAP
jgi:hypothetical protein